MKTEQRNTNPTEGTNFVPLHEENRPTVHTAAAAFYLNRRPQTLRHWAMKSGSGPVSCIRINGRLAWRVADIRSALGVQPSSQSTS